MPEDPDRVSDPALGGRYIPGFPLTTCGNLHEIRLTKGHEINNPPLHPSQKGTFETRIDINSTFDDETLNARKVITLSGANVLR